MRRDVMRLRASLVLLTTLISSAQERPIGKGVNFYSREKEAALGAQLAAELRQKTTPIDRAAVRDYVERIGAKLTAQLLDTGITYSFSSITNNISNTTHEPYALPGGYIFVPAILFLTAENEAEFAGMLAHAITHVAERHYTRQASRQQVILLGAAGANAQAIPLGLLPFHRQFEIEADKLAVEVMSGAGYDPEALAGYIGRVQRELLTVQQVRSPLPARASRIAAIREAIEKLPSRTYTSDDSFQAIREEVRKEEHSRADPQIGRAHV